MPAYYPEFIRRIVSITVDPKAEHPSMAPSTIPNPDGEPYRFVFSYRHLVQEPLEPAGSGTITMEQRVFLYA